MKFNFLWVIDWFFFEYDEEDNCYYVVYYLFIMLVCEDLLMLESDFG